MLRRDILNLGKDWSYSLYRTFEPAQECSRGQLTPQISNKFPLLFPNSQNPVLQQQAGNRKSSETPRGNCTTKVGTRVNVITGGSSGAVGQLNMKNTGADTFQAWKGPDTRTIDMPIKVVNPTNKRESKTYMLIAYS